MALTESAIERSSGTCELCEATDGLDAYVVAPRDADIAACQVCREQLSGELDPSHWRCLQGAIWSEVPAVQVVAVRTLRALSEHGWAADLLDQAYLDDDTQDWADAGAGARTVDCNGAVLVTGDSVTLIKDLVVKGANFTAKRGTLVKNIRCGDDPGLVEGRVNKTSIFLKTEFIKRA